jgi:dTDP-glucose pyrophosphorylase
MANVDSRQTPESWRKVLLPADASLQDVIRNLDASSLQIALIVSPDSVLQGTVTDGDIRRGLLRGLELSSPVTTVMKREPLVVSQDIDREAVLQLMKINSFSAIPVVDASRRVIGLHLLVELLTPRQRPNLMVIMAGGQGSRLRPDTEKCPKPMLPVRGMPMLEHILVRAKAEGFRHFAIAIHYLGHMIEDYFGDGSRWHVNIEYLREESQLGTAGAIGLLRPRPTEPFVVSNGDVITDIHYGEMLDFHCLHGAAATMAVRLHEWQNPFGVVRTDGVDIVGFEEKPITRCHINAGIYVLDPATIAVLGEDERCDMTALFDRLRERSLRTIVYPMHEPWLDVGRPDDLRRARSKQE